jgi:hypothetical protein
VLKFEKIRRQKVNWTRIGIAEDVFEGREMEAAGSSETSVFTY